MRQEMQIPLLMRRGRPLRSAAGEVTHQQSLEQEMFQLYDLPALASFGRPSSSGEANPNFDSVPLSKPLVPEIPSRKYWTNLPRCGSIKEIRHRSLMMKPSESMPGRRDFFKPVIAAAGIAASRLPSLAAAPPLEARVHSSRGSRLLKSRRQEP
jgi:hypothetical protein